MLIEPRQIKLFLRQKIAKWPDLTIAIIGGLAAFGCYTSMYAFRKAFSAGTFDNSSFFGVDYKVCIIVAQMLGYTFSKFYGIKFISQYGKNHRARYILLLIFIAWMALLGFAVIPAPYNISMLVLNGFPLGLIWGLVFSYLEGRRMTELMGAIMAMSLVFAAGFVKSIARYLMSIFSVTEFWMPFATGLLFVLPMLLFVLALELLPGPTESDRKHRIERIAMDGEQRKKFLMEFLPGILLVLVIYGLLTCIRDIRDNFEVEIWAGLGIKSSVIYAKTDSIIAVIVLGVVAMLVLVKNNIRAFVWVHYIVIIGCALIGLGTLSYNLGYLKPTIWMTVVGLGIYVAYIPFHAIFFERMIASLHYKANVGFLIYIVDSVGYLGSFILLIFHELAGKGITWSNYFNQSLLITSLITTLAAILSLIYFLSRLKRVVKNEAGKKIETGVSANKWELLLK
ncbi:DUF5690 family protein [Pedobacter sp. MC2016-05]|uniref:DUF5690 family protein n=1 Tax=Pedobacter sp. MC2016-05 TaxID=2994474 RepID=UPI0022479F71|nr:DUF5690 family protein [Pedobacter sp. MC2016-05]MCX2473770.1 DUF5690 family protein [Pedobacter sp. MC2016-05]